MHRGIFRTSNIGGYQPTLGGFRSPLLFPLPLSFSHASLYPAIPTFSPPLLFPAIPLEVYALLNAAKGSGERCKLPQLGLGRSASNFEFGAF